MSQETEMKALQESNALLVQQNQLLTKQVQELTAQVQSVLQMATTSQRTVAPRVEEQLLLQAKPPHPSKFSSPTKEQSTDEWLFVVENYFDAVGLSDVNGRIGFTTTLLEGSANAWWRLRKNEIQAGDVAPYSSWGAFKRDLVRFFHPAGTEQAARNTLRSLRQTGKIHGYVKIFQRALLQIPEMDVGTQVDAFVHGLKDEVRHFVRTRRPNTILEAVEAAETFENSQYESYRDTRLAHMPKPVNSGPEPMQLGHVRTSEVNALTPHARFEPKKVTWSDRRGRSPSPRRFRTPSPRGRSPRGTRYKGEKGPCYGCGQYGHFKRDCPLKAGSSGIHKNEASN